MDSSAQRENKLLYIKMNLEKLRSEINEMEAQLANMQSEPRMRFASGLRLLKEKRRKAEAHFEDLRSAPESTFETVRDGMIAAWRDLAKRVESTKNSFHNSI